MKQLLRKVTVLSLVSLLSIFSLGTHLGAFSQTSAHTSGNMNHGANSSSCVTACVLATGHKNVLIERDEDDEPVEPFYMQLRTSSLLAMQEEHRQQANRLIEFDPPPDSPAYIRLAVFRA